jgi:hypothetical protein
MRAVEEHQGKGGGEVGEVGDFPLSLNFPSRAPFANGE